MHDWWNGPCQQLDQGFATRAAARQDQLTKPRGALGQLEALAIALAAMQRNERPQVERLHVSVFAGDHGVVEEGVSAYPQSVTGQMLRNFVGGGAALSVLARRLAAPLEVIDLGTVEPLQLDGVSHLRLGPGTANLAREAAMSEQQLHAALAAGRDSAQRAAERSAQLFIGGEMGIGNTTSASALAAVLLPRSPLTLVGPGTGLDLTGVRHKMQIIAHAVRLHAEHCGEPLEALRRLGGFEIAALVGAYLSCAQSGIPVLVDGFICSAAALCAVRMNPGCRPWLIFAHRSAEPGHLAVLDSLGASPLLDLGLRLGEGSGAALVVPLLQQACALHNEMATFAEASVSDRPV
ncbi:nicotinate-nucleotide--dimethylbenzimidazole phosphoribosyltransferase [Pseudomonas stutzeri]|uniref:Nicotinate-nucleotide--dimethylbenzimidazole phosphoribosyltransferase n=1 Tax=Stutzerimonas stutzeri TaxID=316 RepID=A0A2N8S2D5_STUST|nr:nicotinate-nucleotide--dimethylbenzimidazole phosphoribosyltransferase [Stutzerimonas stutzeri]MCQ4296363.1 nicotinate-nucleotide--dimethylbenzimidazole phosphoribosyltransferase [Stutzerimonas stutzeri]PNF80799.1 nicotinate-nucleotide--dimethylbenzimidazole phosphoribosyltransferase [Stutzerimonas stutzeri]